MHVSSQVAQNIIDRAVEKSIEIGVKSCIAVIDSSGNLKSYTKLDNNWVGSIDDWVSSIDIAIKKANTICYFAMSSGEIEELTFSDSPINEIEHSNDGLIRLPGGLPIIGDEGKLIGAIGVSGDTVKNNHIVAQAGINFAAICDGSNMTWSN